MHACALHEDRTISCWGDGDGGKLGQGDTNNHYLPVKDPPDHRCGGSERRRQPHLRLAQRRRRLVLGMELGRAGGKHCESELYSPQRVPGLSDVVMISAGRTNTCAVHRDGDISCWGSPYSATGSDPVKFSGRNAFTSVSIGSARACAVSVAGNVYCWRHGRPGPGDRDPHRVPDRGGGRVSRQRKHMRAAPRRQTSPAGTHNEAGEVGDGTTSPRQRPERVAGISDAVAVSISKGSDNINAHACALRADGSALCWGGNEAGQLGDGTNTSRLVPTPVEPIAPIPADQVPLTPTELMRTWAETVVQEREATHPWMRVAWDYIRDQAIASQSGYGGLVFRSCHASADAFGCEVIEMQITSMALGTFVHELFHVYDLNHGLAPPRAWGAVQLYFATTYPGCYSRDGTISGAEILADTVNHLIVPTAWLTYYESSGCPELPPRSRPSAEAEQVVLQGFAGQVPDWYRENITNGAELWAAWLRGPSLPALANLADEFGGLCSTDWIRSPFDPELFPPAGSNPFRDGGCP